MTFTELVAAALELGVVPALALFLVAAMILQNRRLLRDRREMEIHLLRTLTEIVLSQNGEPSAQDELDSKSDSKLAQARIPHQLPEPDLKRAKRGHRVTGGGFKIRETAVADVKVLSLFGRLTIGEGDVTLREEISDSIRDGWRKIVLDFEESKAIDSSGLGELVSAYTRIADVDGVVVVAGLSGAVEGVFEMTRLIGVFNTFETVEEAVDYLKATDISDRSLDGEKEEPSS